MASSPQRGAPPGAGGGRRPILYQIDFTAVASGKRIAASKRRIRWRFGFANAEAIEAGQTGTACRGEEHDVTFIWSAFSSGKRLILCDGQEIHYSCNRSSLFEFSWTMRGNNVLKIVAHASAPMSPTPGFRQYDFFVNGLSFFSFPKVFRLGLPNDERFGSGGAGGGSPAAMAETSRRYQSNPAGYPGGRGPGGSGGPRRSSAEGSLGGSSVNIANLEAPGNPDEEEAYLQEAIRQSLKPEPKPKPEEPKAPPAPADLLDFGAPAAAATPASQRTASPAIQNVGSDFFSLTETVQSDPYTAVGTQGISHNHQSFASLPALTGPPPAAGGSSAYTPDFAAAAPGALVVSATQSSAYGGYGLPQSSDHNPYSAAPSAANGAPYGSISNPYGAPPAHAASNPYGAPPASASANPYGAPQPAPANPYGAPAAPAATNPYGVPAAAPTDNPYGAPAPVANPYGAQSAPLANPYEVPAATNPYGTAPPSATHANPYAATAAPAATSNPYGASNPTVNESVVANPYGASSAPADAKSAWTPPAPITTQNPYDSTLPNPPHNAFNGNVPSAVSPHPPATPSSLGFGSPAPDFSGFSPQGYTNHADDNHINGMPTHQAQEHVEASNANVQQPSSFIDQTFAKLASFDNFSIESKKDVSRANPFELSGTNSTVGGNKSLADMSKNKPKPAKESMKTPVPAQAMVPSTTQSGPYGGGQYGMQQPQQQQPSGFGQPPLQPQYGQPQQQPMAFGQPPAPTSMYGQSTMSQPLQQQQQQPMSMFGQPPQQQPQQQSYGQPVAPPLQQYGQAPPPSQMYGQQPPQPQQQQGYY